MNKEAKTTSLRLASLRSPLHRLSMSSNLSQYNGIKEILPFTLKEYSQLVRLAIISHPRDGYGLLLAMFVWWKASRSVALASIFWGAACDHCGKLGGLISQSHFGENSPIMGGWVIRVVGFASLLSFSE